VASTRSYGGNGVPVDEQSLGELVATATRDVSLLVHKEIELAKAELTDQATKAGVGVGLLGGAGFIALLAVVLASFAGGFGFSDAFNIALWAGFLCMTGVYLVLAAILGFLGYKRMKRLKGLELAKENVQADLAWAKHPTRTP
jgi:Putative Actinobacterial Holin-X, holin superfamily III